ncbi:hypothetical protein TNCV_4195441 [Trichonephila clavipes]|nr:hypothetical protein TNCV_4195441 [Trichonephila clavipes]
METGKFHTGISLVNRGGEWEWGWGCGSTTMQVLSRNLFTNYDRSAGYYRSPKQFRIELIEKIIFENPHDEFSATPGKPSISPSPLSITSGHFPDVIPAIEKKIQRDSVLCAPVKEIPGKIELHHLSRTLPSHPWNFGRNPGGSFKLMPGMYQTAFSRFVSGHIKALFFLQTQKIFPECHLCYSELVSTAHILT